MSSLTDSYCDHLGWPLASMMSAHSDIFIQFQTFSRALCLVWLVWPHWMAVILTCPNVVRDDINFTAISYENRVLRAAEPIFTLDPGFFLIFVLFAKQRIHTSRDLCSPLLGSLAAALSLMPRKIKEISGTRVALIISERKVLSPDFKESEDAESPKETVMIRRRLKTIS